MFEKARKARGLLTMSEETKIDPKHSTTRSILRILGPSLAGIGLLFTVIGFGSFFSSFGSFEPPRYFWCAFLGLPLLVVGVAMTHFAFLGSINRYYFGEAAPVVKDAFNYLAEGTKGGVRTTAQAIGEGLSAARAVATCRQCNQANDADAKFCKKCGAPVSS
jgi:hypothetical protein